MTDNVTNLSEVRAKAKAAQEAVLKNAEKLNSGVVDLQKYVWGKGYSSQQAAYILARATWIVAGLFCSKKCRKKHQYLSHNGLRKWTLF